jgi:hypothetical protein
MKYGIIFWGNSVDRKKRFSVNKKIVRIIIGLTGTKSRVACKRLFRALLILTLHSQYILSLMTSLAHNLEYLTFNCLVHSIGKGRNYNYIGQ